MLHSGLSLGLYDQPEKVGWLGWVKDGEKTIAFVDLDGTIKPESEFAVGWNSDAESEE